MPLVEYECEKCKTIKEYLVKQDFSDVPKKCDDCNGNLIKKMSVINFDVIGGTEYFGKKNWKRNLSTNEQADVLMGKRAPY